MDKKCSILLIDDSVGNRDLLCDILEDEYEITQADNGKSGFDVLKANDGNFNCILLDIMMPQYDGFYFLKEINNSEYKDHIPILIISGEQSVKCECECFDYGVSDFIKRPFADHLVKRRIRNAVELFSYKNSLETIVDSQTKKLKAQAEKLRKGNENMIETLGNIVEARSLESGEHIFRVKGYTNILADEVKVRYPEYKLTSAKVIDITQAAALHDIGKIVIPDSILLKPGKLTPEEFDVMKTHTTSGAEVLLTIKNIWSKKYGEICYNITKYHHERYDGGGYPDKLVGDAIPIEAQIVAIADVYDALVNERCYKKAFSFDEAFEMITTGKCGKFNPKILDCFTVRRKDFEKFAKKQSKL